MTKRYIIHYNKNDFTEVSIKEKFKDFFDSSTKVVYIPNNENTWIEEVL